VWALGVVLYELLALCHPFEARNQAALVLTLTLTPTLNQALVLTLSLTLTSP